MNELIKMLEEIKDNYTEMIEEEVYSNLRNEKTYKDLTQAEIRRINKYRKNITILYRIFSELEGFEE